MKMTEEHQIRLTLEDTLTKQQDLRKIVKEHMNQSKPLANTLKPTYYELLSKALLSQGTNEPCELKHNGKVITFASLHEMALRVADLNTKYVRIQTKYPEVVDDIVTINFFWEALYNKLLYYYPKALSEATHMSAEQLKRAQQMALDFDSTKEME